MGKYDALFEDDAPPAASGNAAAMFRRAGVEVPAPAPVLAPKNAGRYAALYDEAPPPDVSKAESAVRGGLQGATSGFGDEAAAAIDTAVSKVPILRDIAQFAHDDRFAPLTDPSLTYAQRRDAYRAANRQAEEANPLTYVGGNLAGTAVQTLALPGAGTGTSVGRLAARGAAEGAAAGVGYSNADNVSDIAKDALLSGAIGGGVSAGLGALTNRAVRGAGDRVKKDLVDAITENEGVKATAKTAKNVRRQAEKIADVLDSDINAPIAASLKDPPKALNLIKDRLATLDTEVRTPAYDALQNISGGARAGDLVKPFEEELSRLSGGGPEGRGVTGAQPMKKFLRQQISDMRDSWSRVVSPEEQVQAIADRVVPQGSPLRATLAEKPLADQQGILKEMFGPQLSRHDAAVLGSEIRPIRVWDPSTKITESEARAHLTAIQTAAKDTFGTLAQTPNAQRYEEAVRLAQEAHNAHLDRIAASNPEAKSVVDTVRNYNRESSSLLSIQDALKTISEKQAATNTKGLVAQLKDKGTLLGTGIAAMTGHPLPAIGGYLALKAGAPLARAASTKTNMVLSKLMQQARMGAAPAILKAYAIEQGIPEAAATFLADRATTLMNEGRASDGSGNP